MNLFSSRKRNTRTAIIALAAIFTALVGFSGAGTYAAKMVPHIYNQVCNGCGECLRICPRQANSITIVRGKAVIDPVTCISCRKCIYVCSYGACK